jgi:hypothetical protein
MCHNRTRNHRPLLRMRPKLRPGQACEISGRSRPRSGTDRPMLWVQARTLAVLGSGPGGPGRGRSPQARRPVRCIAAPGVRWWPRCWRGGNGRSIPRRAGGPRRHDRDCGAADAQLGELVGDHGGRTWLSLNSCEYRPSTTTATRGKAATSATWWLNLRLVRLATRSARICLPPSRPVRRRRSAPSRRTAVHALPCCWSCASTGDGSSATPSARALGAHGRVAPRARGLPEHRFATPGVGVDQLGAVRPCPGVAEHVDPRVAPPAPDSEGNSSKGPTIHVVISKSHDTPNQRS